jgi:hypothetical protein
MGLNFEDPAASTFSDLQGSGSLDVTVVVVSN